MILDYIKQITENKNDFHKLIYWVLKQPYYQNAYKNFNLIKRDDSVLLHLESLNYVNDILDTQSLCIDSYNKTLNFTKYDDEVFISKEKQKSLNDLESILYTSIDYDSFLKKIKENNKKNPDDLFILQNLLGNTPDYFIWNQLLSPSLISDNFKNINIKYNAEISLYSENSIDYDLMNFYFNDFSSISDNWDDIKIRLLKWFKSNLFKSDQLLTINSVIEDSILRQFPFLLKSPNFYKIEIDIVKQLPLKPLHINLFPESNKDKEYALIGMTALQNNFWWSKNKDKDLKIIVKRNHEIIGGLLLSNYKNNPDIKEIQIVSIALNHRKEKIHLSLYNKLVEIAEENNWIIISKNYTESGYKAIKPLKKHYNKKLKNSLFIDLTKDIPINKLKYLEKSIDKIVDKKIDINQINKLKKKLKNNIDINKKI